MLAVITHFVVREIAPDVCRLVINLPNFWVGRQPLSKTGDEREKHPTPNGQCKKHDAWN